MKRRRIFLSLGVAVAAALLFCPVAVTRWRFTALVAELQKASGRDAVVASENEVDGLWQHQLKNLVIVGDSREASWWEAPRIVGLSLRSTDLSGIEDARPFRYLRRVQLFQTEPGPIRLGRMQNLELATFSGTGVTDSDLIELAEWHNLESLALMEEEVVTSLGVCAVLRECRITNMFLFGTNFVDEDINDCLREADSLTTVTLHGRQFGDSTANALGQADRLRTVQLHAMSLSDEGIEGLSRSSSIESVWIIDAPHVTVVGVQSLERLAALRELVLARTAVAAEDRDTIEERFPECVIRIGN